ncbi:hypothetical protein PAMA_012778 [Pampus argenteus]
MNLGRLGVLVFAAFILLRNSEIYHCVTGKSKTSEFHSYQIFTVQRHVDYLGPRMAFSIRPGLLCMCFIMLFFLQAQGEHKCDNQDQGINRRVDHPCCTDVSKKRISEPIKSCFEQMESYQDCYMHAYQFVGESGQTYCVDPESEWLGKRLAKLKEKGITCKSLP